MAHPPLRPAHIANVHTLAHGPGLVDAISVLDSYVEAKYSMPVKNMAIRTVLLLLVPAGLISWAYPPRIYFRNFSFPFAVTLASYLTLYGLVLLVSMVLAPRLARRLSRTGGWRSAVQSLVAALAFAVLAGMIGTNGLDVPGTRFFGIFFAEWKFFIFFFYVGLPVAIATGIASFLTEKQTA